MIAVITGAGVSAESGIKTFRDNDGLWNDYKIEDVCVPSALEQNREKVIDFYNQCRKEVLSAQPNDAHYALKELEKVDDVVVITQNIDTLHEKAGSTNVLHLHGNITQLRSSKNPDAIVDLEGWYQDPNARHEDGSLLRPHIVFFEEDVPNLPKACDIIGQADKIIVIGTSFVVYPAALLILYAKDDAPIYIVDPADVMPQVRKVAPQSVINRITHIQKKAGEGVKELVEMLKGI